ncbi:hypothetical protein O181_011699 [Austropuccinia psidii MF-1]|uniref:Uncharacterized protein n=1 Tax=Austropuccinia psidii MF-1 TaxID=1389203 RepID=A0A9Q3GM41_9BASI|nr:hypothetical protein [Austropuccinia psidii MF-1]
MSQCSNLSILVKSPPAPCEIKQLFKSQLPSPFNPQKHKKPLGHDQQNYDSLVEYLQNFHSTREIAAWISSDTTFQSSSPPTSRIDPNWYFSVSNINIGKNIFSTEPKNANTPAPAQAPAPTHATAQAPAKAHTTALAPAHAPAHAKAHDTAQAPAHTTALAPAPAHATPQAPAPKPSVLCGGLQPYHPLMATQN